MHYLSRITPPLLRDTYRRLRLRWERLRFEATGRAPWTPGYGEHKRLFIESAISAPHILEGFRQGRTLPAAFGVGIDERCVELPWTLASLPEAPASLLDAGSALNTTYLLRHAMLRNKTLHVMTLAPEAEASWRDGISYVFGDLRSLPYRDRLFDIVVCVSTLEHIGCDASVFTGQARHAECVPDTAFEAAREIVRVLRPGGRLLLSVPFGRRMEMGHSRQFDGVLLGRLLSQLEPAGCVQTRLYLYSERGWQLSDVEECADAVYEKCPATATDKAAAARAVACVRLDKGQTP